MSSADCDEFYFPDLSQGEVVPIKAVNPLDLQKFKDRFVKVEGWNAMYYFGRVYTIDPVSLCVVLVRRVPSGSIELEMVMGHIAKTMKIVEDHPWSSLISAKELDNLFQLLSKSEDENEHKKTTICETVPTFTEENLLKRKEAVIIWLKKNLLPVKECGKSLVVAGGVTINPPYSNVCCSSGNEIIQNKIGRILEMMPHKEEL